MNKNLQKKLDLNTFKNYNYITVKGITRNQASEVRENITPEQMSGTIMRKAAVQNMFSHFKIGLMQDANKNVYLGDMTEELAQNLFNDIRSGLMCNLEKITDFTTAVGGAKNKRKKSHKTPRYTRQQRKHKPSIQPRRQINPI